MENLLIEKGKSSPYIFFDATGGVLTFQGESFPENAAAFYDPVIKWINEYFSSCAEIETTLEFEIVYFNSSTSKIFMSLFCMLDAHSSRRFSRFRNRHYIDRRRVGNSGRYVHGGKSRGQGRRRFVRRERKRTQQCQIRLS